MNLSGDIAESFFVYHACAQGLEIFHPQGHRSKIDVVVRHPDGPLIGVQVKKGVYQKKRAEHHADSWKFLVGSCRSGVGFDPSKSAPRLKRYTELDFDVLAVVIQELGIVALYSVTDVIGTASKRWNAADESAPRNNWELIRNFSREKD